MAYNFGTSVTTSDTVDLPMYAQKGRLTDAIYVGNAGDVVAVWQNGMTATYTCAAGELLPIGVRRINATNTTATGIVANYLE